jgi:hypothetical protein
MAQTNGATNIGSALSDLNFTREQIIQCSILHEKWRQSEQYFKVKSSINIRFKQNGKPYVEPRHSTRPQPGSGWTSGATECSSQSTNYAPFQSRAIEGT